MEPQDCFSEESLEKLRTVVKEEPRVAAIYLFGPRGNSECNLAALFTELPPWPDRLDLELAVAKALDLESVELINLRRMSLVARYDILNRGQPLCVCHPEDLAVFIEDTLFRYASYYPLLEALYWKVETGPLSGEHLNAPWDVNSS